jgi:hypothetical protein
MRRYRNGGHGGQTSADAWLVAIATESYGDHPLVRRDFLVAEMRGARSRARSRPIAYAEWPANDPLPRLS